MQKKKSRKAIKPGFHLQKTDFISFFNYKRNRAS